MDNISVRLGGIAAAQILLNERQSIYIDAFNVYNEPPSLHDEDFLVFTHDDRDHFSVDSLPDLSLKSNMILGPPSIVLPILKAQKARAEQLIIEYPQEENSLKTHEIGDIKISFVKTTHFIDWGPIHCSFLIEISGKKIFLAGDSNIVQGQEYLKDIDCIVCNLIHKGFLRKTEDPRHAIHYHLSYMLTIISLYNPKIIIASHMIGHKGAVNPQDMKELVDHYGFHQIIVPLTPDERVDIKA
jgi:L-ascorbate metabolism protein UlaG (beta-lactamase superfamily)